MHRDLWSVISGPLVSNKAHSSPSIVTYPENLPIGTLPRHDVTPGAVDPRVTQQNLGSTICRPGYSASVRPPFKYTNAMKHRLMGVYGVAGSIHDYELDHLIPIGVGGCPDCENNLWPEPRNIFPGAKEKDEVEDYLHPCTVRSVRAHCRLLRHSRKSPPTGMRFTKDFTRMA